MTLRLPGILCNCIAGMFGRVNAWLIAELQAVGGEWVDFSHKDTNDKLKF